MTSETNTWSLENLWGDLSETGFTAIPNTLIKAQAKLELTPTDLVVLANLIMHWWKLENLPFPRTSTIAKRSGLTPRTIQRSMQKMTRMGLIKRVKKKDREYVDLSGLKDRLAELASEHSWAFESSLASRPHKIDKAGGIQSAGLHEVG